MAFDLIQSEYGLTDDQVLDLTTDRISQMVRAIGRRQARLFRQSAKLLEAAVRILASFSAQSEQALKAAREIQLIGDEPVVPPPPERVYVAHEPDGRPAEPLDEAERKVTPIRPAEDLNRAGSFERLAGLMSGNVGP